MKIKRYFAADMRQAIRMVRDEQGPDAVILSNKRVNDGVEIVAAIDYDAELIDNMAADTPKENKGASEMAMPAMHASRDYRYEPPEADASMVAEKAPLTGVDADEADDSSNEEKLETLLFGAAQNLDTRPTRKPEPHPVNKIEWSQDPSLVSMREEIKTLRGLLESQLTGLAWNDSKRSSPLRAQLMERLTALGIGSRLCRHIAEQVKYTDDVEQNWRQALGILSRNIRVTDDDIISNGGVVAVVGATGVGKTTTVAKLAARYALRHGRNRVALVTTDSYRIGAHQQLKTYGNILGVPVHLANDSEELRDILAKLRNKSLVLIDTAGMSQRDMRLSEQFTMLRSGTTPIRIYAVLSATTQRAALNETVKSFGNVDLDGCIVTKVDESTSLGEPLSVIARHRLPVAYVGDGQRVPEDLHPARANNMVARAVALMQKHAEEPSEEEMAFRFAGKVGNIDG